MALMSIHPFFGAIAVAAVLAGWLFLAMRRNRRANTQHGFRITGGRGGVIEYRSGDRIAHLSWEMLVGETDLALYIDDSHWVSPTRAPLTPEERSDILSRFDAWARATRMKYEVIPPRP